MGKVNVKRLFNISTLLEINLRKKLRLMSILFLIMAITSISIITSYDSQGEITLPESLLSQDFSQLRASWGEAQIDRTGDIVDGENASNSKVIFGEDDNGKGLKWWIVNRDEKLLTLYSSEPVENGFFNSYSETLSPVGNYGETNSNNWVTSAVRVFFGRNLGEYPGDMNSRTGNWDSTASGDKSEFEGKYFTDSMVGNIIPNKVVTYDSLGNEFISMDRFWLPLAIGAKQNRMGIAITANPIAKPEDDVINRDSFLIPNKYLAQHETWLRYALQDKLLYFNSMGKLGESLVTSIKGYSPVMQLSIKDLSFVSVIQGDDHLSDGVVKPISWDSQDEYYLKFGRTRDASVNINETLTSCSQFKIPYYSIAQKAYLIIFLTNLENGNVYYSSKNIEKSENGEAEFDLSSVPTGKYEIKTWIEIPEDDGKGKRVPTEIKTSTLNKGYEVKFEHIENVQFFDEEDNEITDESVIVDGSRPFSYVAKVNKDYNMDQVITKLVSYNSPDSGITLNPNGVSYSNPNLGQEMDSVQPLSVGGSIITQGMSSIVYETRAAKNYWNYTIPKISSDVTIKTFGAGEENEYIMEIGLTAQKIFAAKMKVNGTEINDSATYIPDKEVSAEMLFKDKYYLNDLKVSLVPKRWTEEIMVKDEKKQVIKESCIGEYEDHIEKKKISLDYSAGSSVEATAKINYSGFGEDLVLFMEGESIKMHTIKFVSSESKFPDIYSVGELYQIVKNEEILIPRMGLYDIEHGSSVTVRFYLDDSKYVANPSLNANFMGNGLEGTVIYNDNKICYEWTLKDISSHSNVTIGNFKEQDDIPVTITSEGIEIQPNGEDSTENSVKYSVKYGSPYKFNAKPSKEYHWNESGISITNNQRAKTTIIKKSDSSYDVVVYSEFNRGITKPLGIELSGADPSPYVHNLELNSNIESLKFFWSNSAKVTDVPDTILTNKDQNIEVSIDPAKPVNVSHNDVISDFEIDKDFMSGKITEMKFDIPLTIKNGDRQIENKTVSIPMSDQEFSVPIEDNIGDNNTTIKLSFRLESRGIDDEGCEQQNIEVTISDKKYMGKLSYNIVGLIDLAGEISFTGEEAKIDKLTAACALGEDNKTSKIEISEVMFSQNNLEHVEISEEDVKLETGEATATVQKDKNNFSGMLKGNNYDDAATPNDQVSGTITADVTCDITLKSPTIKMSKDLYFDGVKRTVSYEFTSDDLKFENKKQSLKSVYKDVDGNTIQNTYQNLEGKDETSSQIIIPATDLAYLKVSDENGAEVTKIVSKIDSDISIPISVKYDVTAEVMLGDLLENSNTDKSKYKYINVVSNSSSANVSNITSALNFKTTDAPINGIEGVPEPTIVNKFSIIKCFLKGSKEIADDELKFNYRPLENEGKFNIDRYIWIDTKKNFSDISVKLFSGNVSFEEVENLPNLLKIGEISSNSKIAVLENTEKIIKFGLQSDINFSDALNIFVKSYPKGSSEPTILEMQEISSLEDFSKLICKSDEKFKFYISPKDPYDANEISVSATTASGDDANMSKNDEGSPKYWILDEVNSDINVSIAGLERKTFNFTYPNVDNATVYSDTDQTNPALGKEQRVEYGSKVSFTIRPNEGHYFPFDPNNSYNLIKIQKEDDKDVGQIYNMPGMFEGQIRDYTVTVNDIKSDITLVVNANPKDLTPQMKTYKVYMRGPDIVSFKRENDQSYGAPGSSDWEIDKGGSVKFSLKFADGFKFDEKNMSIHVYDSTGDHPAKVDADNQGLYLIDNVQSDIGVLVKISGGHYEKLYMKFEWDDENTPKLEKIEDAIKVEVVGRTDNFVKTGIPAYYGEDVKFNITVLKKYSETAANLRLKKKSGDVTVNQLIKDSDMSKGKFAFETSGGVRSGSVIGIDGIYPNKSKVLFKLENIKDILKDEVSIKDEQQILNEASSFQFRVETEQNFIIQEVKARRTDSIANVPGTNVISNTEGNDYEIKNLLGEVQVDIIAKKQAYNINFFEQDNAVDSDKFWIESVSGGEAKKIDNKTISVMHGEETKINFGFKDEYDKFDGGKKDKNSSGVGNILISSGAGKLTSFVKNTDNNQLQITGIFTSGSGVALSEFQINNYDITFSETTKGYELYASKSDDKNNVELSYQITPSTRQYAPHKTPYSFFIRPLGGGFDLSASSVTAVLATGERIALRPETYEDKRYVLYQMDEVLRDVYIEISPKKQVFQVVHEGYNVSFYDVNKKSISDSNTGVSKNKVEVEAGDPWIFYVKADAGYDIQEATAKTNTGVKVLDKGVDGEGYRKYQIDKIDTNTTVIVENVKLNTYRIQFAKGKDEVVSDRLLGILSITDDNGNRLAWDSMNDVLYGTTTHSSKFRFVYKLDDKYTQSKLKFTPRLEGKDPSILEENNYKIEQDSSGYWEVKSGLINQGKTITIDVSDIDINIYKISFSGQGVLFDNNEGGPVSVWNEDKGTQEAVGEPQTISHEDGEYVFRVRENIHDGYSIDSRLQVKTTNGTVSTSPREGQTSDGQKYKEYTLTDVTAESIVSVEGAKSMFYSIDFKTDINDDTDSIDTPPIGLKILDTDGRDISTGIRSSNGSSVKFSLAMDAEYTQVSPKVSYRDSGQNKQIEILPIGEYYTISDIRNNFTIRIDNLKGNKNKYMINFAQKGDYDKIEYFNSDGNIITNKEVTHGENYSFVVKAKKGYEITEISIEATNSTVSYSQNGSDTRSVRVVISNVTGDSEIIVRNVTLTLYNIAFSILPASGETITQDSTRVYAYGSDRDITSGTQVYYQKGLKFRVQLSDGYNKSQIVVEYKQEGDSSFKTINPAGGYYSIDDIVGGTSVNIKEVKQNKYSIKFSVDSNNVTLKQGGTTPINPSTILKDVVKHGESFQFSVESHEGYNITNLLVTTKDADVEIIPLSNTLATVVLSNVIGDLGSVSITGINKNTYLVSFAGTEYLSVFDEGAKDITKTGKEVNYRGVIEFTLEPHTGYDQRKGDWIVQYETKNEKGEVTSGVIQSSTNDLGKVSWKYQNVVSSVEITIANVQINNYKINFTGNYIKILNSVTDKELEEGDKWVSHGGYYTFKIKAAEGYDLINMAIEADVGDLIEESRTNSEAIYTLSNITKDATIDIRIDKSIVEVTFTPGIGSIYVTKKGQNDEYDSTEIIGKQKAIYGSKIEFRVKALDGYDIKTLKVNQGKNEITFTEETQNYKTFITTELKADCEITTSIEKKKYNISFPVVDGIRFYENDIEIKGGEAVIVRYGDAFKFRTTLDDKHNQSSPIIKTNSKVPENGEEITVSNLLAEIGGFYTITEISNNIDISVENIKINQYKVNLVKDIGIQYNSSDGSKTDISGIHVVSYGDTFSFTISPIEGYEISNMVVTVKEQDGSTKSITPSRGVYSITNIRGDKTINVRDQDKIQYTVRFEPADGVTYVNDTGLNIKDPILVTHGHNFEFSIKIGDAYDDSVPSIQTSSSKTQAGKLSTGKYLLSDITEDITIKTLNVVKNKYSVNLKEITGVIYKSTDGRILTGNQYVEYEGRFQFRVDLYPAYSESSITAMDGKEEIRPENDGSFLITGIMENKTVTVTGIEENPEVKLINMINSLKDSIRDASDVDAVVQATKIYDQLSDAAKGRVTNLDKLKRLQQESGTFIHTTNDITVEGVDWYIKLVAVPLSSSSDEMGRVYEKLDTEFVLSLYNIYLWDMMAEKKHILPEGDKVTVSIPTPDLTYFKDTFIVHEKSSDGKLEYLILNINGNKTSFDMTSFSPVGMAAKRKVENTHSSFFDTVGANIGEMNNIISSYFGRRKSSSESGNSDVPDQKQPNKNVSFGQENIDEKFKQSSINDARWSALRLLLVLAIGFISAVVVTLILKNRRLLSRKKHNDLKSPDADSHDMKNDIEEFLEIDLEKDEKGE